MIVQCEQCNVKYRLEESKIPRERVKVKCTRCQHIFLVSKESPPLQEPTNPASIEEALQESTKDSLQCPNCGFQQPASQDCIKCGIVFSKYKPRSEMPPPPSPPNAGGFSLDKDLIDDQAEVLSMTYAGFWRRFGAYF
ncbi:MAG: zinc-ribbon domain-containing protein, partial [Syntrophobacterales bacterium]